MKNLTLEQLPQSSLIIALLKRMQISCVPSQLQHMIQKQLQIQPNTNIAHFLGKVLQSLKIGKVRFGQFSFSRFDRTRLPALIKYEGDWYIIERDTESKDSFQLLHHTGQITKVQPEMLSDCLVLWCQINHPEKKAKPKKSVALRLVLSELFKKKSWFINIAIATVLVNILGISTSIFAMQTYDRVVPTLAYTTLTTLATGMVIVILTDWLLKVVRARILDKHASQINMRLSQTVFDHLVNLRIDKRPKTLGTLSAQINGLDSVRQFFSSAFIFYLVDMPFALMFIFFIYIIGGPVSYVYLGLLPFALVLSLFAQYKLRDLLRTQMLRSHERQGMLVDTIRGAETIRSSNSTWRFSEQWQELSDNIDEYSLKSKAISNLTMVTTGSFASFAYILAIIVGVTQIELGELTMGGLIACSILGGRVITPVSQGIQQLVQWQHVSQSLTMIDQLLNIETERLPEQTLLLPYDLNNQIELEKVRFTYGDKPINTLNIESLTFNPGDRVVLVGSIGSGKSTLLKILAGLYKPSEGRVKLAQADLWDIDPSIVNENIGYLPQNVTLFKGTLYSNLILSGVVDDTKLMKVINDVGLGDLVKENSNQMDIPVSEGGEGLSEGQRQLVGLARMLIGQHKIWLLDEPTSSMDLDTEIKVLDAIDNLVQPDDIVIISTHRPLVAAKTANRVIALRKGEVVIDGKPEDVFSNRNNQ